MSRVAPCGHPGEAIIGTYVRCLQGCDGGQKATSRRGEPGHVDSCACSKCDVRRRATTIVYRSKDGRDIVRAAWDGVAERVDWEARITAQARHWVLEDAGGKKLASGPADNYIMVGITYGTILKVLLDRVSLSVVRVYKDVLEAMKSIDKVPRPEEPAHDERISRALKCTLDSLDLCLRQGLGRELAHDGARLTKLARLRYVAAGGSPEEAAGMILRREFYGDNGGHRGTRIQLEVRRAGRYWAGRIDVLARP